MADLWTSFVAEGAQRFGLPTRWIRAVMQIESAGRAHAVAPEDAMGLMQIMPTTYAELRARYVSVPILMIRVTISRPAPHTSARCTIGTGHQASWLLTMPALDATRGILQPVGHFRMRRALASRRLLLLLSVCRLTAAFRSVFAASSWT